MRSLASLAARAGATALPVVVLSTNAPGDALAERLAARRSAR